jgi:hypothetical protein
VLACSTCPLPVLRTAALHALASIAGAERMHASSQPSSSATTAGFANGRGALSPASPEARLMQSLQSRRAALLSADSEQKLRSAVYTAVHNNAGTVTLAEVGGCNAEDTADDDSLQSLTIVTAMAVTALLTQMHAQCCSAIYHSGLWQDAKLNEYVCAHAACRQSSHC